MGDAPHAADDIVQVARRLLQDLTVGRLVDVDAADIEFHGRQEGTEAIVQVIGNPLAFIFPDGDFGKDLFPLQFHIPAMIPDDGYEEVDNDYCYYQRYQQRNIKDLVFHY
jgi:hypothetical protein